ncbi:MAG: hypothetical protein KAX44_03050 [Candidatus Brocadiae bacterium]|nr:hypothetical protein [Candidatus Brocadiia bacterium]
MRAGVCRVLLVAVAALALGVLAAEACEMPLYQYSLEYWPRESYCVFEYYGPEMAGGADVAGLVAGSAGGGKANVEFRRADVTLLADAHPGSLVRRVWERHEGLAAPFCVVVAPNGSEIFAGPMGTRDAELLVRSPQRHRLAQLLAEGKEGLLLLLTGSHPDASNRARQSVETALQQAGQAGHDVGWMVVDRQDPDEVWTVRQLLAVRPDLALIGEPMLFGVFGRGRVVEPRVGEQITAGAVADLIEFFNAPCACDVVYEILSVDLLTDFHWPVAASEGPVEDERPYYSLFAPPPRPQQIESPAAAPTPAVAAPAGGGLFRNALVALGCLAVVAFTAGFLVLKRRTGS